MFNENNNWLLLSDQEKREQKSKQAHLKRIAMNFDVSTKKLNKALHTVHAKYTAKLQEYEQCPEQDSHYEVLNKIASRCRSLIDALVNTPDKVNDDYVRKIVTTNTGDELFYDAIQVGIKHLEASVSNMELNRYKGEHGDCSTELKRKTKLHNNQLVLDIAAAYTELTKGKKANMGKQYKAFLHDACDYMDIDSAGLWSRHKNHRAK